MGEPGDATEKVPGARFSGLHVRDMPTGCTCSPEVWLQLTLLPLSSTDVIEGACHVLVVVVLVLEVGSGSG